MQELSPVAWLAWPGEGYGDIANGKIDQNGKVVSLPHYTQHRHPLDGTPAAELRLLAFQRCRTCRGTGEKRVVAWSRPPLTVAPECEWVPLEPLNEKMAPCPDTEPHWPTVLILLDAVSCGDVHGWRPATTSRADRQVSKSDGR